jgi:hypothetical protein
VAGRKKKKRKGVTSVPLPIPKGPERVFQRQLRAVANATAGIINAHLNGDHIENPMGLLRTIESYSAGLLPWGTRVVNRMLEDMNLAHASAWSKIDRVVGARMRIVRSPADVSALARQVRAATVARIVNIPTEGLTRTQAEIARLADIGLEASLRGERATEVVLKNGFVSSATTSYAGQVSRTAVAAANASVVQMQAETVGADSYVWTAVMDSVTRPSHALLDQTVQKYSDPPQVGDGSKEMPDEGRHGPGEYYGCRCYAAILLPSDDAFDPNSPEERAYQQASRATRNE